MSLRSLYPAAVLVATAVFFAATLEPSLLLRLADEASARVNADHIRFSCQLVALWFAGAMLVLARTRPTVAEWPPFGPFWLYGAWIALCTLYTAYEHGWIAFPGYVYEEDGVLETVTAGLLLIACAGFAEAAIGASRAGRRAVASVVTLFSVLCLVFLMEELSWGQRIFGWETPDNIERINVQDETNLHNMFQGSNQLIRLVVALLGASLLLSADFWRARLEAVGLSPLVPGRHYAYFVPIVIYAHAYDELFEEVMALFLIVYMMELRPILKGAGQKTRVAAAD